MCAATSSCLLALSPPFEGLVEGHWHPYSPLTNLNFLNKYLLCRSFFLAGVSNPVFKQRENWWDVCIDWTAGRVISKHPYSQQSHYSSDLTFIRRLLHSIEANSMGEEEIRQQFYDYTQYIADLALARTFLQSGSRRVQKMLSDHASRIEKWEQSQVYLLTQGALNEESPSAAIRQLLTRLRVGMLDNSLDDSEAKKLYFEVDTLLCTDKDCMELLSMLPNQGDLRCFTWGLFRTSRSLQDCAMSILLKLEENEVGKVLIAALNSDEREKFGSLKASKIR